MWDVQGIGLTATDGGGEEDAKMKIHIQRAQVAPVLQGTNEIRSRVEVSPLSYVLASPP